MPVGPQMVAVLVPGAHVGSVPMTQPQAPPPTVALQAWPTPQLKHSAPSAPQSAVDCAGVAPVNGRHAFGPVGAKQQPLHVAALHVQTPPLHVVPVWQTLPHVPQLLLSLPTFTQAVPHAVSPAAHWQLSVVVLHVSPVTVEQSVSFTNVPAGPHICTASSAGEQRVALGAQVPTQPCPLSHV